jgi:outer membrane murein-binding lipoprotein Lpp
VCVYVMYLVLAHTCYLYIRCIQITNAAYYIVLSSIASACCSSVSHNHCHHCCNYCYCHTTRLDEAESQVHELEAKVAEIEKQQALLNKLAAVSLRTATTEFVCS